MNASLAGAATTLVASFVLARVARSRGWGDGPGGPDGERKLQQSAVPAVGGVAIALGACVVYLLGGLPLETALMSWSSNSPPIELSAGWLRGPLGAWALALAAGLALASGGLDDLLPRGLSPLLKLTFQALVGVILVSHEPSFAFLAAGIFLSILAQNSLNTFDNADGACAGVSAAGLYLCGSPLAPVVGAFLLPNLLRRPGSREPFAYLGDAGSQLLGVVVLLTPGAWPVLVLPFVDLTHVACRRLGLGLGPWHGDRRHLAHRLQRAGLGVWAVAGLLLTLSMPVLLWPGILGTGGTLLAYGGTCWATRRHAEPKSGGILPTN